MKKSDNRLLKRVIATALATVNRVIEAKAIGDASVVNIAAYWNPCCDRVTTRKFLRECRGISILLIKLVGLVWKRDFVSFKRCDLRKVVFC